MVLLQSVLGKQAIGENWIFVIFFYVNNSRLKNKNVTEARLIYSLT